METFTAVADIEANLPGIETNLSWIELNPKRPVGLFAFHPNKWRIIYRLNKNETREEGETTEFANKIINNHFGFINNYKVLWVSCFRLGQGQSSKYYKGRIALAGDAAHPMGPSAGAGMMVGMLGVWRLAFRLKNILTETNNTIIANTFSEYETDQRKGSESIQKANAATFSQIALDKVVVGIFRNILLKIISFIPFITRKIVVTDTLTDQNIQFEDYDRINTSH